MDATQTMIGVAAGEIDDATFAAWLRSHLQARRTPGSDGPWPRPRPGLRLADVIKLTGSLGRKVGDAPETFDWADAGGAAVEVEFDGGRCRQWRLLRPGDEKA
jgi:hypothetical protein